MAKSDLGKLRYDLVPPGALSLVAACFTYGTKHDKPGSRAAGYLKAKGWRTLYQAALMRHLEAYRAGEWAADDSKLPHLAHLATNALILLALELRARTRKDGP